MKRHTSASPGRPAFTLIELLVVIALIGFMAALGIMVVGNVNEESRSPRGASQVQQWLQIAKNRALRDRAPRGVRLIRDTTNPNYVFSLQYLEQPEDFYVAGAAITGYDANTVTFTSTVTDFTGGFAADATQITWPIQVGDYLEVNGGLPHRITSVTVDLKTKTAYQLSLAQTILTTGTAAAGGTTLTVTNPANIGVNCYLNVDVGKNQETVTVMAFNADGSLQVQVQNGTGKFAAAHNGVAVLSDGLCCATPTTTWRIRRAPRPAGDEQMDMPQDIGVDLSTNATYAAFSGGALPANAKAGGAIDIVFSPSGEIVGPLATGEAIYLWVRDTTLPAPPAPASFQGDSTVVVIYTRSGAIAAHPVDSTPNGDPYRFTRDGRSSGQ